MKELNIDLLAQREKVSSRTKSDGKEYLFDPIRKKEVRAQPEEWVRQLILRYLIDEACYPASLIQVEKQIAVGGINRRFDVLIYDRKASPFMIIECKSFKVSVDQKVFDQAALYNLKGMAPYLWVSNGITNVACAIDRDNKNFEFLDALPPHPAV